MLTTTKNNLTYITGHVLDTPALIQGANRKQARAALDSETLRIYASKGYKVPSYEWLNVPAVVIV
jgi:hypothetical protein